MRLILSAGLALSALLACRLLAFGGADDVIVKPDAGIAVLFDGHVSKFEYVDAVKVQFKNGHGTVDAFLKQHEGMLYFAFEMPDETVSHGDDIVVMLDKNNGKRQAPDKDTIRAYIRRKIENSRMDVGDGKTWVNLWGDFEYRSTSYMHGWEVECRIPLAALGIEQGQSKAVGLMFRIFDNEPQKKWVWPGEGNENNPSTWAVMRIESRAH